MTGLEFLRASGTTVEEIADVVSAPCPPIVPESCDGVSCRECWFAWAAGSEMMAETGELSKTTHGNVTKNNGTKKEEAKPYRCPRMMELSSLMREWQQQNSAPWSALKICVEAFLAEERKKMSSTSHL